MRYLSNKTTWTSAMKEFTESTLDKKLNKLIENPFEGEVKVAKVDSRIKVDVSYGKFRAQAINEDFYIAIIEVANKLKSIITKSKKAAANYEQLALSLGEEFTSDSLISKEKEFILDPITVYEAIREFENTDYPFYVFRDCDESNLVSILYKRHDGTFGVIRCK